MKQLENFEKLQAFLGERGFVALPVPGDGNCSLHSLMALASEEPTAEYDMEQEQVDEVIGTLRSDIAILWKKALKVESWTRVYHLLIDSFEGVTSEASSAPQPPPKDSHAPPLPPPKEEPPVTPPKRGRPSSEVPITVDLSTPPRVEKVGGCRSGMRQGADAAAATAEMERKILDMM